jgi:hypothetical protein
MVIKQAWGNEECTQNLILNLKGIDRVGDLGVNVFVTEVGCMDLDCVSNIFE